MFRLSEGDTKYYIGEVVLQITNTKSVLLKSAHQLSKQVAPRVFLQTKLGVY